MGIVLNYLSIEHFYFAINIDLTDIIRDTKITNRFMCYFNINTNSIIIPNNFVKTY